MKLYLIRHGRTNNNVEQACQGWTDTELDDLGNRQAIAVAQFFESVSLSRIFSSDLKRSVDSALPLSSLKSLPLEKTKLLRERSLGQLENAQISALRQAFEDEIIKTGISRYKARPMGVESAYDVMKRATQFSKLIPIDQGNVAVFTHGMTEECLLCCLLGAPVESSRSFNFDNASITELRWDQNVWVLEKYNQTRHLDSID